MLEEHRLDVELVRLQVVEDELRVVRPVVVAHAGVVAADDEVRAAVVLTADRMPDRLARPGVAHRRREGGQKHAVLGVVAAEQRPVALDAHIGGDVVRLRVADEWMDEQAVDSLQRDFGQVLVRAVDRVARLEADDATPPALGERGPRLGGVARELRVRRRHALEDRDTAAEIERLLVVQACDAGMLGIGRAEAPLGLPLLVVLEDLLHLERGEQAAVLVREGDDIALGRLVHGQAHGQRPGEAGSEPHVGNDALVVLAAHEAFQRRQRARGEHVQIGHLARRECQPFKGINALGPIPRAVDERPAVRTDEMVDGDGAHGATAAFTSPSSSSFETTSCADSSGECASVSITSSGFAGSSYGSSTPVKPLISPANAFS